ncbi:AaceriAFR225Wp [[Ashbya] aceris (nom. inval.)]|nr:AaceriAFR225Wp [[Ashbya] aceris (nom. inval.)]
MMGMKYRYDVPLEKRSWRDTMQHNEKLYRKSSSFDADSLLRSQATSQEGVTETEETVERVELDVKPVIASEKVTEQVDVVRERPLISTEVLDVPSQRALAFSLFVIIQTYKLYDLVLLKSGLPVSGVLLTNSKFNFISKYAIVDSLFLYFLPSFKIPKLRFRPIVTFLQIMLAVALTILLSNDTNIPLISLLVSAWGRYNTKELSLTGASVNHRKIMDTSSHFKGAHTIKILPENTVMFNPFHESFCLPMEMAITDLKVPIRINSTSEISFLQLEHHDIYTNEVQLLNFTKKELTKMNVKNEPDPQILYLQVPLERVGFYQLKKIVDTNNFGLRIYKPQVIVSHCPMATVGGTGSKDKCIGDQDTVTIQVTGVPPMKLKYTKTINNEEFNFIDSSLQPEYFESPLLSNKKTFTKSDIADLKWARTYPVDITLESFINSDGVYSYAIDEVVDGLGNVMDFKALSPEVLEKYELEHTFNAHDLPRASLDEKINPNSGTKRSLLLHVESSSAQQDVPYLATVNYEYENERSTLEYEFTEQNAEIFIENPGAYTLTSIRSKYCSGAILGKSTILVTKPIPPQLSVKSTPILDQCIGQVGLNFDLTFTGVPPFYYTAKIYKNENGQLRLHEKKDFKSQGTRNQFSYNPTTEGHYEIVFDAISNTLFKDPIPLLPASDYTFNTSMRVKANAVINTKYDSKLCLGDQSKIPVKFTGEPPFNLDYDIVETSSNKRISYHLDKVNSYHYEIQTPPFNVGGDYILSLISVKDSSGCVVPLSGNDARINVRRDIPTAAFSLANSTTNELKIKEGSTALLPLRLSGEQPFTVRYQHINKDGTVSGTYESKFQSNYRPVLKVNQEGSYRLLSMKDHSCNGNVESELMPKVTFFEKPTFSVVEHNKITKLNKFNFAKEPVCQGFEETVDLSLVGSAPFTVMYELTSPNGQITSKSIQVATKYASLKLPNDHQGEYILTVKAVYDSYYTQHDLQGKPLRSSEVTIRQTVNPLPTVRFADRGKTYRTCSANVDQPYLLDPIPLHISGGKGPYSISFNIYHESTSKTDFLTLDNVTPDSFDYKQLYHGLKLGNHIVSIEKVVDKNGCVNDVIMENSHVLISITDVPKIVLMDPTMEYCVGDYVSYQLNGVAPFLIKYEFNGVQLKSKEQTSQFVRFASEPGMISINSIQDSSSHCVIDFSNPALKAEFERLSLLVHPIPSVTVSQGDNVIEDIHEGDQAEVIFTFEGTPPFSLTYVRTEEVDGRKGRRPQIVETHKVTDIYSYEYRVSTSLQGTYEAIEVADAFCSAKNDAFFNNY